MPEALEVGCVYRGQFERQLAKAGVVPPETMEFQSIEAVKRCVATGMGVSVLLTVTRIPCQKRGAKIPSSNPLRERYSLSCGHDRETSVLW